VPNKLEMFASAPTVSPAHMQNGNTPWAQNYTRGLRDVVTRYAARLPRNLQRHLGPSELGHVCDRQLVGKMAGVDFGHGGGNMLHDPWPSIVGTALHAFMEQAFTWDSEHGLNPGRWLTERRVTPDPGAAEPHPGTADLYDAAHGAVVDWKMQSEAIRYRLRKDGPPYHYYIQMLLYGLGYMHLGFPVSRVVLVSWPRTKSSMDDVYAWERQITASDIAEVAAVLDKTVIREQLAGYVAQGAMSFWDIPPTPSVDDCTYCPFYNPAALADGTARGCPGTSLRS
jgi:hypothetical protein